MCSEKSINEHGEAIVELLTSFAMNTDGKERTKNAKIINKKSVEQGSFRARKRSFDFQEIVSSLDDVIKAMLQQVRHTDRRILSLLFCRFYTPESRR